MYVCVFVLSSGHVKRDRDRVRGGGHIMKYTIKEITFVLQMIPYSLPFQGHGGGTQGYFLGCLGDRNTEV